MQVSSVKSLLSALHMLSHQSMTETSGSVSSASSKQIGSISFSVDRMISILVNNLHSMFFIDYISTSSEYSLSFPCCRFVYLSSPRIILYIGHSDLSSYDRGGTTMGPSGWPLSWGDTAFVILFICRICGHCSGFYWHFNCILQLAEHSNQNLRNMALDALDQSICAVLGSEQFGEDPARSRDATLDVGSLFIVLA